MFVGDYRCSVISATTTELVCETPDSTLTTSSSSLPISVRVGSKEASASKTFVYHSSYTAYLSRVYPSSAIPGMQLALWGVHRVSTLYDDGENSGDFL